MPDFADDFGGWLVFFPMDGGACWLGFGEELLSFFGVEVSDGGGDALLVFEGLSSGDGFEELPDFDNEEYEECGEDE